MKSRDIPTTEGKQAVITAIVILFFIICITLFSSCSPKHCPIMFCTPVAAVR